jgi:hypothetical protein
MFGHGGGAAVCPSDNCLNTSQAVGNVSRDHSLLRLRPVTGEVVGTDINSSVPA